MFVGNVLIMNETSNQSNAEIAGDERHSLQTYVSDMLALERHINAPISKQLADKDAAKYPEVMSLISSLKSITENHITALEGQLKALGGHEASPLKSAWSSLLGAGAAAVGSVRKTRVSKNLRDDHTALSLSSISYTMLHATACGLGDMTTAQLAERHLKDITPLIMQIGRSIPQVVLLELEDDGENVDVTKAGKTVEVVENAWRQHPSSAGGSN
ncbi:MAG: hypothetical protein NVSMB5_03620 [Candidatus Velthaea sp.]